MYYGKSFHFGLLSRKLSNISILLLDKSRNLWEGFFSAVTLLLAHERSHVVKTHRHEITTDPCGNRAHNDFVLRVNCFLLK